MAAHTLSPRPDAIEKILQCNTFTEAAKLLVEFIAHDTNPESVGLFLLTGEICLVHYQGEPPQGGLALEIQKQSVPDTLITTSDKKPALHAAFPLVYKKEVFGAVEILWKKNPPEDEIESVERFLSENAAALGAVREWEHIQKKTAKDNEFLKNILESLTYPFYVIDAADYTVTMANTAAVLTTLAEGVTCYTLTHGQDAPCNSTESPCPLDIVKETKAPVTVEHTHYDEDGTARSYEIHGYPIFDAQNNITHMIEYCIDITKRTQIAQEKDRVLHNLEERVKELSCLYGIDEIERKKDITVEEMLEEVVRLVPLSWQYPEDAGCCITFEGNVYKTNNFNPTQWMLQAPLIIDSTEVGTVAVCYLDEKPAEDEGPFLKEERNLIDSVAIRLGDFIERREVEEALQDSEEKFRTFFEKTAMGIAFIDLDVPPRGNELLTAYNPALQKFFGYTHEELATKTVQELSHPEDMEKDITLLNELLAGNRDHYEMEKRFIQNDGQVVWGNMTVSLIRDKKGNPSHVMSTLEDITERKRAEIQLKTLFEASRLINSTMDTRKIFKFISDAYQDLVGFDNFMIFLGSDDGDHVYVAYASEGIRDTIGDVVLAYGEGLVGYCIAHGETVLLGNAHQDKRSRKIPGVTDLFTSLIVVPLVIEDKCVGAIHISKIEENAYDDHDVEALKPLSEVISSAIRNSRLYSEIKEFSRELENRVAEKSRRTEIILDARQNLQAESSWEKGLITIVETMGKMGFELCGIFLVNPKRKTLDFHFGRGPGLPEIGSSFPLVDSDYFGVECVVKKETVCVEDYTVKEGKRIVSGVQSFVWVPIVVQGEAFAAIAAGNTEEKVTEEDVKDLEILAGMCASFIDRTRILVEPVAEKQLQTEFIHWLDPAECYIVLEKKPVKSYEIFIDLVTHGIPGFVITREYPDKIKRRYKLLKTPMLWLSRSGKENAINPEDLPKLNFVIGNFTKKSGESVILLDGLEYLMVQTGFDTILKYLHELADLLALSNSRLIMPLHRNTLSIEEYSILERAFTVLDNE
jgi:PAS domain S-box-containing protein